MVVMRYIEMGRKVTAGSDAVIKLPYVQNTLILLGWAAIFLNIIFLITSVFLLIAHKANKVPRWILLTNAVIFLWQIAYHFNLY